MHARLSAACRQRAVLLQVTGPGASWPPGACTTLHFRKPARQWAQHRHDQLQQLDRLQGARGFRFERPAGRNPGPAQRPLAGFSSSLRGLQLQRAAGGRGQGSSRAQGPVRVQALFEK